MRRWKSISGALILVLGMAESSWGQSIITTVAGGGVGDGGPATTASLVRPSGIFGDAKGNLFIADAGNNRLRKVDAQGLISTVAGTGEEGYSSDGGPATMARPSTSEKSSPPALLVKGDGRA